MAPTKAIMVRVNNQNIIYRFNLGVGPKPVSSGDTKNKGKVGSKAPQPGDIGIV